MNVTEQEIFVRRTESSKCHCSIDVRLEMLEIFEKISRKQYARKSTIYILDNRLYKSILNSNT